MFGFGPFGEYVIPWYGRELERLESLQPANEEDRRSLLLRVEDMRVELDDLTDEGFDRLSEEFNIQHHAQPRLTSLYDALYRPGDEKLLHPNLRADHLAPPHIPRQGYASAVPLETYLDHLCAVSIAEVPADVAEDESFVPWRKAAGDLLAEQVSFTHAACQSKPDGLICLLRDMLPSYLIARWQGFPCVALPLGRAYLDRFGPDYEAYDYITGPLYHALTQEPRSYSAMWALAVAGVRQNIASIPCMKAVAQALHQEAEHLFPSGRLLVLETGLQATMPLLLAAIFPRASEWFMYTAAPWLLDIYQDRLFRHQYTRLRPCETLACTDNLFRITFESGQWMAEETLDDVLRGRAYWEIAQLKNMCRSKIFI